MMARITDSKGKLPWKFDPDTFKNNRVQALDRDAKLMKRLKRESDVMLLFEEQMDEMISTGIIRKVDEEYPKRYLPLLVVTNIDRDSTKVRLCLEARCKFDGKSFNDYLLNDKIQMTDIFQILTRFRSGKWAIQGDIKKMFWQIKLTGSDERFHGVMVVKPMCSPGFALVTSQAL